MTIQMTTTSPHLPVARPCVATKRDSASSVSSVSEKDPLGALRRAPRQPTHAAAGVRNASYKLASSAPRGESSKSVKSTLVLRL